MDNTENEFEKYLIWIDINNDSNESKKRIEEIDSLKIFNIKLKNNIEEAMNELLNIKFEKTIIILIGDIIKKFFQELTSNIEKLYIIPKIYMLLDNNKKKEIEENIEKLKNYLLFDQSNIFYEFSKLKNKFLKKEISNYFIKENLFIFQIIKQEDDLILPINYQQLILKGNYPSKKEIYQFNTFLFKEFSSEEKIKNLLSQILIFDIPITLLIKFWLRLFSFYSIEKKINEDLLNSKSSSYSIYIFVLYFGLNKNYINPCFDKKLFRGGLISLQEYNYLKKNMDEKKEEGLPCKIICYCKIFLKFSLDEKIALEFLNNKKNNIESGQKLIFFEIEAGDKDLDKMNATNTNFQQYSFYPNKKEILFFPYSCFGVSKIENEENNGFAKIKLIYLGVFNKQKTQLSKIEEKKWMNIKHLNLFKNLVQKNIVPQNGLEKIKKEYPKFFQILKEFMKIKIKNQEQKKINEIKLPIIGKINENKTNNNKGLR